MRPGVLNGLPAPGEGNGEPRGDTMGEILGVPAGVSSAKKIVE